MQGKKQEGEFVDVHTIKTYQIVEVWLHLFPILKVEGLTRQLNALVPLPQTKGH
jgi:hypothetical protein